MSMERRDFLKGAALVGGTAAAFGLAGCAQQAGGAPPDEADKAAVAWDQEHDIVIVGAGGAGLVCAIAATQADPDASIVVLEKLPNPGGSTIVSGGNIGAMGTDNLLAYAEQTGDDIYKDDTFEMYWQDKLKAGCYYGDPDIARLFCYNSRDNFNWLESLGIKWSGSRLYEEPVEMPSDFTKSAVMQASQYLMTYDEEGLSTTINRKIRYNVGSTYKDLRGGGGNFQCLLDNVGTLANVEIVTGSPVKDIVRENQVSGEVLGVVLEDGKAIRAKRAVVLAAGGFGANGKMLNMYDPRIDPSTRTSGGQGNTGDMIVAASLVGAQLLNTHCIQIDFGGSVKEPSMSGNNNSNPFGGPGDYIDVGKDGKRFWTEKPSDEQYMDAELMTLHQLGYTSWFRLGDSQSVAANRTPENLDTFKSTYGSVVDTIDDLAKAIGCDAATLKATIDRYNTFIDSKVDTEFGKSKSLLAHKIEKPPFYVFEAGYYCRTTPGGLRIDTNAQVLDVLGEPIPRLYACGEVTGNVHGRFRNNGGDSWCDLTCFGRIAGANAAAAKPIM
ncbi:MAG: FAD-dependent oxidoreductase [Coriobacteriaceae bacterium]|jgi:fumarate reductase flavoprotein subunit|nr:FAD-dependent oxidoreductase [Coriobacteriaceae bacterium]